MKTPREARVFTTTRAMSTSPYDRFRERNILRELEWLQRYGDVPNLFDEHFGNEEARNQAIATEQAYLQEYSPWGAPTWLPRWDPRRQPGYRGFDRMRRGRVSIGHEQDGGWRRIRYSFKRRAKRGSS